MSLLDRLKQLFAEAKAPAQLAPAAPTTQNLDPSEVQAERRQKKRVNAAPGTRILVVDDSPTIVALLGRMLRQNQYTVLEAVDAEAGLLVARAQRPALIFLDIVLPGMSGFTALRTLRHDPVTKDIPIIMISGNVQATEQFYVQRIGADDFMKKPFSRAEVFTYIEKLLDENFVLRRFNTYVHDTVLEPIPDPVDELAADPDSETTDEPAAASMPESSTETTTEVAVDMTPAGEASAIVADSADVTPAQEKSGSSEVSQPDSPPSEPATRDIFVDINAGWRR